MSRCNLKASTSTGSGSNFETYVATTKPINQSTASLMTSRTSPDCGRPEAIRQVETVRPILDRLYPERQSENAPSKYDEFKTERNAARRLLARLDNHEEVINTTSQAGNG